MMYARVIPVFLEAEPFSGWSLVLDVGPDLSGAVAVIVVTMGPPRMGGILV